MARRGKIGGLKKASLYPPHELTRHARSAFLARFERDVDPEGVLDESERLRRAQTARRAYFAQLARLSAQKRRSNSSAHVFAPDESAAGR